MGKAPLASAAVQVVTGTAAPSAGSPVTDKIWVGQTQTKGNNLIQSQHQQHVEGKEENHYLKGSPNIFHYDSMPHSEIAC